jgi:segregation and condensation protein A
LEKVGGDSVTGPELDKFEEQEGAPAATARELVLDLDGFEGPIDVLLVLARGQKVDLTKISILDLAEQYLVFVAEARRVSLELAADYLVMAAWLAYLKSRLLLPEPETDEDEPSAPELAEALKFQLRRIESMQDAGAKLMARPRVGRDVFNRGAPEGIEVIRTPVYELTLFELLQAYSDNRRKTLSREDLHIEASQLFNMAEAAERMRGLIGKYTDWNSLMTFLPPAPAGSLLARSAVAATFGAALEMTRAGQIEMRQSSRFGPIHVRAKSSSGGEGGPESNVTRIERPES